MKMPTIFRNVTRAGLLDVDFYNRAELDTSLDGQAAVVVIVANAAAGVGAAFAAEGNVFAAAGASAAAGIVGWLLWSYVAMVVGTRLFGGTSDFGQMRRVIGFAYAPLAIGIVPYLGPIGAIWVLLAAVIAIREGMEFSTQRSIATMVVGWGAWVAATVAVNVLVGWDMRPAWPF